MRTFLRSKVTLLFMSLGLLLAVPAVALADQLRDTLDATASVVTITEDDATGFTNKYYVFAQNGGADVNGTCDVDATHAAVFDIVTPTGVTATPNQLTFTQCSTSNANPENPQSVKFTSDTANPDGYSISARQVSGPTMNVTNAAFTLKVNAATVTNTAPVLTLPGNQTVEATSASGAVVTYTATANDAEDGALTPQCNPASGSTFPLGTTTVNCSVTDSGGKSASGSFTVTVRDTLAPSSSATLSPAANANGWNKVDVTVTLNATDSGSGVKEIRYTDDGTEPDGSSQLYSEPFTVSSTTTIKFRAEDEAGNVESPANTAQVNIDKAAPTITGSRTPGANAYGWNNSDVTVSFQCADTGGSGVATCSGPTTLSSEGAGQSVTGNVADRADNTASRTVSDINIDKTNPTVNISGFNDGATYTVGATLPTPVCDVQDSLSGAVDESPDATPTADTRNANGVGKVTYKCTGSDKADNTADSESRSFSVVYDFSVASGAGFLQPINYTAHQDLDTGVSTFKGGSTVPAKFRIENAQGQAIKPLSAEWLKPLQLSATTQAVDEDTYALTATNGTQYVWNSTDQLSQYNWSTKGIKAGFFYRIGVKLDDGQTYYVYISLR